MDERTQELADILIRVAKEMHNTASKQEEQARALRRAASDTALLFTNGDAAKALIYLREEKLAQRQAEEEYREAWRDERGIPLDNDRRGADLAERHERVNDGAQAAMEFLTNVPQSFRYALLFALGEPIEEIKQRGVKQWIYPDLDTSTREPDI